MSTVIHQSTAARLSDWLRDTKRAEGSGVHEHPTHPWWRVMCLTGADYFSTLGYQPGIAFLAAGYLSPLATLVLVIVTLFGALPVYSVIARRSPDGQGSISMLTQRFPGWTGKLLVLILLGFAATDFIITMTLSAADATAHLVENPHFPHSLHGNVAITLVILAILGGVFLLGFREAIAIAVVLVVSYLALNLVVVAAGFREVLGHPSLLSEWRAHLFGGSGSVGARIALALIVFPKLALGLSGFETGVAVIPLIRGDIEQRVRGARRLLLAAALIMSFFLIASSILTTMLIPPHEFQKGGQANGRALAFLAHRYLGEVFGTVYDVSTICILAFAGASAMAGLLNLVPRYLPSYGMAPEWARASRPLVLVFTVIAFAITVVFQADVDAQGGAYATGVLVLMTSAATAVAMSAWRSRARVPFVLIAIVFVYTAVANMFERPEGIRIASFFIVLTVATSLLSRALRATELRITHVTFDDEAVRILDSDDDLLIRVVAHRPGRDSGESALDDKDATARFTHHLSPTEQLIFVEIEPTDASEFTGDLAVRGVRVGRHMVLRASSPAIPNAFAAILLEISRRTGRLAHAYFGWTEGNPIGYVFRFLIFGEGDVAPITREVLRQAIPEAHLRPTIHVS